MRKKSCLYKEKKYLIKFNPCQTIKEATIDLVFEPKRPCIKPKRPCIKPKKPCISCDYNHYYNNRFDNLLLIIIILLILFNCNNRLTPNYCYEYYI